MVRPSSASLNSLAQVLRQAEPLYRECSSIINNLGSTAGYKKSGECPAIPNGLFAPEANGDADYIHHPLLELSLSSRNIT
jgi:hypothetical protein